MWKKVSEIVWKPFKVNNKGKRTTSGKFSYNRWFAAPIFTAKYKLSKNLGKSEIRGASNQLTILSLKWTNNFNEEGPYHVETSPLIWSAN